MCVHACIISKSQSQLIGDKTLHTHTCRLRHYYAGAGGLCHKTAFKRDRVVFTHYTTIGRRPAKTSEQHNCRTLSGLADTQTMTDRPSIRLSEGSARTGVRQPLEQCRTMLRIFVMNMYNKYGIRSPNARLPIAFVRAISIDVDDDDASGNGNCVENVFIQSIMHTENGFSGACCLRSHCCDRIGRVFGVHFSQNEYTNTDSPLSRAFRTSGRCSVARRRSACDSRGTRARPYDK